MIFFFSFLKTKRQQKLKKVNWSAVQQIKTTINVDLQSEEGRVDASIPSEPQCCFSSFDNTNQVEAAWADLCGEV